MENKNLKMLDDIRIKRSVKYLTKTRDLSPKNIRSLLTIYNIKGYKILAKHLKCKISQVYKSDEYIKQVFLLLEETV